MKKSLLIILSIALLLLFQTDAFACRCGQPTNENSFERANAVEKSFEKASVIFTGEVIKLDLFRATLKVEKVWKGKPKEEIVMLTGTTKTPEGYQSSSCDYEYGLGQKYLIYAYGSEDKLKTNDCSRTKSLEYAGEDIKELEKLKQELEIKNEQAAFHQLLNLTIQWTQGGNSDFLVISKTPLYETNKKCLKSVS
jgi:hypothetical protein